MGRESTFDVMRFHATLDEVRSARHLQWRQVAEESGVSASTLTRIAQGRRPDVDGLIALISWAALDANHVIDVPKPSVQVASTVIDLLRRDRALSKAHAETIIKVFRTLYELFASKRTK